MKILNTLFFLLLAVFTTYPQTKITEQPKDKIVKSSQITEKDGFTIAFPSKPTREVKPFQAAFGMADMVSYKLSTTFAYYLVNTFDFPTVLDKDEINVRFEVMKNSIIAASAQNRLMKESEVMFGEHYGTDFLVEGNGYTVTTRGIFVKQRFFQISVITNGKQSKATQRVRKYNEKLVNDFINSFVVTKIPPTKDLAVELPDDFGVKLEDENFTSDFFKFSMQVPQNWDRLSEEEMGVAVDLGLQASEGKTKIKDTYLKNSIANTKFLLSLTSQPNEITKSKEVFLIAAERISFPTFLPSMVVKSYAKDFIDQDEKVTKLTNLEKFGGEEFAWIELEKSGKKYKERIYVSNQKGIALQIFFTYQNQTQLTEMLNLLKTIKFEKK